MEANRYLPFTARSKALRKLEAKVADMPAQEVLFRASEPFQHVFNIETRTEDPLLPLSIFRLRTLAGANVVALLLGGSFFAFVFAGTLFMQQVMHYSALQTGLAWLAASVTSM